MRSTSLFLLRLFTALLLFSGFWALAMVPGLEGMVILGLLILSLWLPGEWIDSRFPAFRWFTKVTTVAFTLMLPLLVLQYGLRDAVLALVIYITVYKLIHRKMPGDYRVLFLMAFFLLVFACADSPSAGIAVAFVLFLFSGIWALAILQVAVEMHEARDVAPCAVAPLGQDPLAAPPPPDRPRLLDRGFLRAMGLITVGAFALCALLFVAVPRMEAGVLGTDQVNITVTGLSETVDLNTSGTITDDPTPVMRVAFPELPGGVYGGELYLRSTSYNFYDDGVWERLPDTSFAPYLEYLEFDANDVLARQPVNEGPVVRQEIFLDRVPRQGLPILSLAQRVETNGDTIRWDGLHDYTVVLAEDELPGSMTYTAWSEVVQPTPEELRAAPPVRSLRSYGQHSIDPRDFAVHTHHLALEEETIELARQLTEGLDNDYDKVMAIQGFLQGEGFLYTINVPPLPEHRTLDAFIREYRIGHCQLYASAMALMLRSQGIVARVVSGYRGGEWAETDESYVVRADRAHMWVEVFFPGYGWITFDPSPASSELPSATGNPIIRRMTRWTLLAKMLWYRNVVGFEGTAGIGDLVARLRGESPPPAPAAAVEPAEAEDVPMSTARRAESEAFRGFWLRFFLAVFAGAALVSLFRAWRNRRRRGGPSLTRDQQRAIRLYEGLLRRMMPAGRADTSRTANEMLAAVAGRSDADSATVEEIVRSYERVRFGGRPFPAEEYNRLREELRRAFARRQQ